MPEQKPSDPDMAPDPFPATQDYTPQPEPGEADALGEKIGTRIGPYTLLEAIGEGGMGSVFRAEQTEPVRRTVALKLIKAGMDTRHVLARFEAERQALALMDHPNIARVLDAGATEAGRPYFVMELVRGVPITKYCDEHGLTPRERLALFIPVCQAIQHAHQKGIIHRDIKPSNVLVAMYDGKPVPKVIDFGVAKATEGQFADGATFTGFGNVVGTPEYMSPEQAMPGQLDIDTRSDVYALGILLYELLTGSTPHDRARLKKAALLEVLRIIRDEEPRRPSTKLSSSDALPSIAANRRMEPARLTRLMRGELDWVVMRALEKDRDRRYATASGFAADVQRYLDDEPVSAGPPSQMYRLRKFVRRNKASVVAASLVLIALLAGVVGTSIGMVRAERARAAEVRQREAAERARADEERQRGRAQTIAEFMQTTLEGAGPAVAKGRDGKLLKELMDAAAARIDAGKLKDDPEAESELRRTIGNVYQALAELGSAEDHLRRSVALAKAIFDADDKRIDSSDLDLGACLLIRGQYGEARSIAERVVAAADRRGESDSERAASAWDLLGLAQFNVSGGELAEAEKSHQRGLAIRRRIHPGGVPEIGRSLRLVAFILREGGAYSQAEPLAREALEIVRTANGPLHPDTINNACALADILNAQSKYSEEIRLMRATLQDAEALYGPDHRGVADVLWRLGIATNRNGNPKAAEPLSARCLAIRRQCYPGAHKDVASALVALAHDKLKQGNAAGAEPLCREALDIRRKLFDANSAVVASSIEDIGDCQESMGRHADARKSYTESLDIWRLARPNSVAYFHTLNSLAMANENLGELDVAIDLYRQVVAFKTERFGPDHIDVATAMSNQSAALFRKGLKKEAEDLCRRSVEIARKAVGSGHPLTLGRIGNLAHILEDRGELAEAETLHREFLAVQRTISGPDHVLVASVLARLGDNLVKQNKFTDAEPVLRECWVIRKKHEPELWTTFNVQSMLGGVLLEQTKYTDAEPLLLAGYEGIKLQEAKIPPQFRQLRITNALERLVQLYIATDKPNEAAKWQKELETFKEKAKPPAQP